MLASNLANLVSKLLISFLCSIITLMFLHATYCYCYQIFFSKRIEILLYLTIYKYIVFLHKFYSFYKNDLPPLILLYVLSFVAVSKSSPFLTYVVYSIFSSKSPSIVYMSSAIEPYTF